MGYHNGVPITVVSSLRGMLAPTESTSRRRAEEDARFEETGDLKCANPRIRNAAARPKTPASLL